MRWWSRLGKRKRKIDRLPGGPSSYYILLISVDGRLINTFLAVILFFVKLESKCFLKQMVYILYSDSIPGIEYIQYAGYEKSRCLTACRVFNIYNLPGPKN